MDCDWLKAVSGGIETVLCQGRLRADIGDVVPNPLATKSRMSVTNLVFHVVYVTGHERRRDGQQESHDAVLVAAYNVFRLDV